MKLYGVVGEFAAGYILTVVEQKLNEGVSVHVVKSMSKHYRDLQAIRPYDKLADMTEMLTKIFLEEEKPLGEKSIIILPSLEYADEDLKEFFKALTLETTCECEVYIEVTPSPLVPSILPMLDCQIQADEDYIIFKQKFEYTNRKRLNDAIYDFLRKQKAKG